MYIYHIQSSLVIGHCMMQLYCILHDVCIEKKSDDDAAHVSLIIVAQSLAHSVL